MTPKPSHVSELSRELEDERRELERDPSMGRALKVQRVERAMSLKVQAVRDTFTLVEGGKAAS